MKSRMSTHQYLRMLINDHKALFDSLDGKSTTDFDEESCSYFALDKFLGESKNLDRFDGDGITLFDTRYSLCLDMHIHNGSVISTFWLQYQHPKAVNTESDSQPQPDVFSWLDKRIVESTHGIPLFCDQTDTEEEFIKIATAWELPDDVKNSGLEHIKRLHAVIKQISPIYLGHLYDEHIDYKIKSVFFDPLFVISGM